ncbi:flagellar basal body rod protein FlgB [Campylobacter sp. faydin G-105]|uniref:flagellar basal body rod protein FlgB n=1 Tax=Campylobacter anatolicus TaxID=2829105 RepID=UPI001B94AA0F|nr:flagellar basal body rod protein FlgB [Campylobacter anatolicus]MBR8462108.1 flagellar basal body rod protein FlgB [Campylobacter anatolicus]
MFVLQSSKSRPLVEAAMAGRELRQKLIAGNISNIDTPFYKARDINFEDTLREKANEIYNKSGAKTLKLAQTDDQHIPMLDFPQSDKAQIFLRDGHMARNDANTVDLDIETTELSKNSIMLSALDSAYKANGTIFKNVIDASGKI